MGDSLRGLALGDGFGERWFHYGNRQAAAMIRDRRTPTEAPFSGKPIPPAVEFLNQVAELTPPGVVREGLFAAAEVPASTPPWKASDILGNGQRVRASDTVPFPAWVAAHHPDCLADALWATAAGLGDVDTTCAITGGIVGARTGIEDMPEAWLTLREHLPDWAEQL